MQTASIDRVVALGRIRSLAASGEARRIRERAGLSQAEIGDGIGVSASAVARWEAGSRSPHGDAALRYLDLLERLALR